MCPPPRARGKSREGMGRRQPERRGERGVYLNTSAAAEGAHSSGSSGGGGVEEQATRPVSPRYPLLLRRPQTPSVYPPPPPLHPSLVTSQVVYRRLFICHPSSSGALPCPVPPSPPSPPSRTVALLAVARLALYRLSRFALERTDPQSHRGD